MKTIFLVLTALVLFSSSCSYDLEEDVQSFDKVQPLIVIEAQTQFVVSGVLGVTSCVVGIVSTFINAYLPSNIQIKLENGANLYLQLVPSYMC